MVHKSVTSLMTEANLQEGGLVHQFPCTKSREKLQELFQGVLQTETLSPILTCFCVLLSNAMSVMTRVPNFIL